MKQFFPFVMFMLGTAITIKAQSPVKLDFITIVPAAIKTCGALYTYDTVAFKAKKYVLLTDFQNLGLIRISGRDIKLQLTNATTVGKNNISTYEGGGYTVILTVSGKPQTHGPDLETGTIELKKGSGHTSIKIHGQSDCDDSKQEGNG